jgi:chromosome segregation ATPase
MKLEEEIKKLNDRLTKAAGEVLKINRELSLLRADFRLLKNVVDKNKEFIEDQERTNRKLFNEMNDIARTLEQLNKRLNKMECSKD